MNCHLLVPGLVAPEDAGPRADGALRLPALETMLARGEARELPASSLELWLAGAFRVTGGHDLPFGALSLRGDAMDPGEDCWLRADPAHLRLHGDRVLLAPASRLDIRAAEAAALTGALNAHFAGEGLEFIAPTPLRWYVRTRGEPRMRTTPTAEVADRGVARSLPEGEDGARWRAVINETQMLLHAHPCNDDREARGAPPVNCVWLWGAGRIPAIPPGAPYGAVCASDPLAAGIALTAGLSLQALPQSGALWLAGSPDRSREKPHLLVIGDLRDARQSGTAAWRGAVAELDARWLAPLLEALRHGTLRSLTLHAPGPTRSCVATVTRPDTLRFWRRRRVLRRLLEPASR
jgi:hypothetical protein